MPGKLVAPGLDARGAESRCRAPSLVHGQFGQRAIDLVPHSAKRDPEYALASGKEIY